MKCPSCEKYFPDWYPTTPKGLSLTVKVPGSRGYAKANFEKHKTACAKKMKARKDNESKIRV